MTRTPTDIDPVPKPVETPSGFADRLRMALFVCLGLLAVLNLWIRPEHPHFGLDRIPGFWAVFGTAGAILLGRGAKGLAHTFLARKEDYYEVKP